VYRLTKVGGSGMTIHRIVKNYSCHCGKNKKKKSSEEEIAIRVKRATRNKKPDRRRKSWEMGRSSTSRNESQRARTNKRWKGMIFPNIRQGIQSVEKK